MGKVDVESPTHEVTILDSGVPRVGRQSGGFGEVVEYESVVVNDLVRDSCAVPSMNDFEKIFCVMLVIARMRTERRKSTWKKLMWRARILKLRFWIGEYHRAAVNPEMLDRWLRQNSI